MTPRNHILRELPREELERLLPLLQLVRLQPHDILYNVGDPIDRLYFPESCVVSLIVQLIDGRAAECGVVGCEGVLGVGGALSHGASHTIQKALTRGSVFALQRREIINAEDRFPSLYDGLHAAHDAFIALILQSAACFAVHPAPARLARALLNIRDRSSGDALPVTQETLSVSIGASRPTTSTILGEFEHAGMISARRGAVEILDRGALQNAACCCYRMTADLHPMLR